MHLFCVHFTLFSKGTCLTMTDTMTAGAWNTAIIFGSQVCTVFWLYPFRDFAKTYKLGEKLSISQTSIFCLSRYRGLVYNPYIPLFLALPGTLLYSLFICCGGGAAGVVAGGVAFASAKLFVKKFSVRMSLKSNRFGAHMYSNTKDCITRGTAEGGAYSWFAGLGATSIICVAWHGLALWSLSNTAPQTFQASHLDDIWRGFRAHAALTLLTNPMRNTFRSALYGGSHSREPYGGVRTLAVFASGENAIFQEAFGVAKHAIANRNFGFFFEGALRTTFKTSLPFGLTYAVFRDFGGRLPGGGLPRSRGEHHGHNSRRRS